MVQMAEAEDVNAALTQGAVTIESLFTSSGAAVRYDGVASPLGSTPSEAETREVAAWLRTQHEICPVYQSRDLCKRLPHWGRHTGNASGLLVVFLSDYQANMPLWPRSK